MGTMGIDVDLFTDDVEIDLKCAICTDVLENPREIKQCQHIYCDSCIKQWIEERPICPTDQGPVAESDLGQAHRYVRNALSNLRLRCMFCGTIIGYEQYERHRDTCDNNPENWTTCTFCSTDYKKNESDIHEDGCIGHLRDKIRKLRTQNNTLHSQNDTLHSQINT